MAFEDVAAFDSTTGFVRLGDLITGAIVVAQRVALRVLSDPGSIPGDPDIGLGLARMRNADFSPDDLKRLQSQVQAEAMREQGVTRSRVSVSLAGTALSVAIDLLTSEGAANVTLQIDAAGARAFFS
mgnify:FL=1